ncbi:MAG: hypothetical protein QOJ05_1460 [Verrucomicrobiota bacterium]
MMGMDERANEIEPAQVETLRKWLSANEVDALPKFDKFTADGIQYEYFHRSRDGSEHRVSMNNPPGAPIGSAAVFVPSKRTAVIFSASHYRTIPRRTNEDEVIAEVCHRRPRMDLTY